MSGAEKEQERQTRAAKRREETALARNPELARQKVKTGQRELDEAADRRELARTWAAGRGLYGWLTNTNHKNIATRYIVTAFVFFLFGGIEAALMRLQLARPESHIINPDLYNQIFTVHGTTMMFLFAVPIMEGMGLYLVPLMIGTRNVAFPRLNAFGYYTYLIGGLLIYVGFILNIGPDTGWFS